MKTSLSKSRYTKYCQCAKALHNLNPLVQNGGHAMTIFPKIKDMPADEAHPNRLSGRLCKALSMGALDLPSD